LATRWPPGSFRVASGWLQSRLASSRCTPFPQRPLGWTESDLAVRRKSDPSKLALATLLRAETTLTLKQIAEERLQLGKPKGAKDG
jgi:hypothetical protein